MEHESHGHAPPTLASACRPNQHKDQPEAPHTHATLAQDSADDWVGVLFNRMCSRGQLPRSDALAHTAAFRLTRRRCVSEDSAARARPTYSTAPCGLQEEVGTNGHLTHPYSVQVGTQDTKQKSSLQQNNDSPKKKKIPSIVVKSAQDSDVLCRRVGTDFKKIRFFRPQTPLLGGRLREARRTRNTHEPGSD
jgi:hypothetical protein